MTPPATPPNWEALSISLDALRLGYLCNDYAVAKAELIYLLDHLHQLQAQVNQLSERNQHEG